MKDWNAPHPDSPAARLKVAKLVMWVTGPINRADMWAARVVFENKMRNRGNPVGENHPPVTRNLNTPHPDSPGNRLKVAKLFLWATSPLDQPTLWAAQVMVENKMRNSGIPVNGART